MLFKRKKKTDDTQITILRVYRMRVLKGSM